MNVKNIEFLKIGSTFLTDILFCNLCYHLDKAEYDFSMHFRGRDFSL